MIDDMAHDADHALGKQPGTVRLCATRRDRRASFHRYACKRTRSWHHGSPETHGTTGCCIRSKSSRSAIHPFRDGNTRSQSAYISAIAERAGHPIAWTAIDVPTLRNLRLVAVAGRHEPLAAYLRDHLVSSTDASLDRGWSAARLAGLDTPFKPGAGRSTAAGLDSFGTTTYRADPGVGRTGAGR